MENYVTLQGVLMNKPVLRQKNKFFTVFDLLFLEDKQQHMFSVIAFEEIAKNVVKDLKPRHMIRVEGKLQRRTKLSQNGTYYSNMSIVCNEFHDFGAVDENFNIIEEEVEEEPKKKVVLRDKKGRFVSKKK